MHVHWTVYAICILSTLYTCTWWSASKYEHLYLLLFHFLHISHLCQDAEASIPHRPRHILPLIGAASHILPLITSPHILPLVTGLSNIASCNWPPRHILRSLFFLHGLPHSRQHHFDFPRSSQTIHQCQQQAEKFSREEETWNQTISDLTLSDLIWQQLLFIDFLAFAFFVTFFFVVAFVARWCLYQVKIILWMGNVVVRVFQVKLRSNISSKILPTSKAS